MNILSSIISIYISIFVNLYIWESDHGIGDVSLYNASMYVCWGLTFALASRMNSRFSIRPLLALSALCGGLAFLYLMTVHLESRMLWIVLLGVPVGMMFGLSQSSQNLSIALQGKENELAPYFAAVNITSQVLNMAVPIFSAAVIEWFGYNGSFVAMLLFIAAMLAYSAKMPKIYVQVRLAVHAQRIKEPLRLGLPDRLQLSGRQMGPAFPACGRIVFAVSKYVRIAFYVFGHAKQDADRRVESIVHVILFAWIMAVPENPPP